MHPIIVIFSRSAAVVYLPSVSDNHLSFDSVSFFLEESNSHLPIPPPPSLYDNLSLLSCWQTKQILTQDVLHDCRRIREARFS